MDHDRVVAPVQLRELELRSANPSALEHDFQWRVKMEALAQLPHPIEMTFLWLGKGAAPDTVLDEIEVGPLAPGTNEFTFNHAAPSLADLDPVTLCGTHGLMILFGYHEQVFLRVGYFANVAYWEEGLNAVPPAVPEVSQLGRNVLVQKPLLTTVWCDWSVGAVDSDEDEQA